MNISKNKALKPGIHQMLLLITIILLMIVSGCAGSKSAQSNKHRKPVSTGKRKCGCSMLTPDSRHAIKLYQQTYYVLQA
jgi:hypothetical protein